MMDHIFWRLRPCTHLLAMILLMVMCGSQFVLAQDEGLEGLEETAFKQAAALVDPSLVRIETVGGLEQLDDVLLAMIASGRTSASICFMIRSLRSRFSVAASMTMSALAVIPGSSFSSGFGAETMTG